MRLDDLSAPSGSHKRKRRLGRGHGSGRGKTAGRGTKGQLARSGGGWNPRFEGGQTPLHLRLPHRRGFKNPFRVEYEIFNLDDLTGFEAGATVSRATLEAAGLVKRGDPRPLKLLADGEIAMALHFDGLKASASARRKVEAAGGSFAGLESETSESGAPPSASEQS